VIHESPWADDDFAAWRGADGPAIEDPSRTRARELEAAVAIPVFASKFAAGWPEHEDGDPAQYLALADALTTEHATDAHFATYSVPSIERRLATEYAFARVDGGVPMVLFVVDVEPDGHAPVTPEWWSGEHEKLERLLGDHPRGFVYRTRGGYRIVYRLGEPFVLASLADAERWKLTYLAWLDVVRERYGIAGDRSCKDWGRLFRLPCVVRDGQRQKLETLGDADAIGAWCVEVVVPEPARPREPNATAYTPRPGDFDPYAFVAAHYPGSEGRKVLGGTRFEIECFQKHLHGSQSRRETTVFIGDDGKPGFNCFHDHCAALTWRDFHKWHDPDWVPFDERPARTGPKLTSRVPDDRDLREARMCDPWLEGARAHHLDPDLDQADDDRGVPSLPPASARPADSAPAVARSSGAQLIVERPRAAGTLTPPLKPKWRIESATPEWLTKLLPPREHLLVDTRSGRGAMDKTGVWLFGGAGGAGKSYATIGLGLAIANGGTWLRTFKTAEPGRVLIIAAEDESDDIRRRAHAIARTEEMSPDSIERFHVLPIHDRVTSLVAKIGDAYAPSDDTKSLCDELAILEPYDLLVIDPYGRIAGVSVDADNAAAAATISALATIASAARGLVLGVTHTSLRARIAAQNGMAEGATGIRGATGQTDFARGVIRLEKDKDAIWLSLAKANHVAQWEPVALKRGDWGELMPLSMLELGMIAESSSKETKAAKKETARRERDQRDDDVARKAIAAHPELTDRQLRAIVEKARACGKDRAASAISRARMGDQEGEHELG
jgi:hypothetical protein